MRLLFVCLLATSLFQACTSAPKENETIVTDSVAQDTVAMLPEAPPPVIIYKDSALDNLARFVAGLPQLDSNSFSALESDKYWQEYKTAMDKNWDKMFETRLSKMSGWRDSTLAQHNDSLTLFYPFSGPDFLHANYLYPHASTYILAALEPIAAVPQLDTLPLSDRDKFLDTLGVSLRDIFQKSYFITKHMKTDLKQVKGVLPPLYFFIQRSGHEFISQTFIGIDSTGNETEVDVKRLHWEKTPGVKLVVRNLVTQEIKTIYYFSVSISNGGLTERPGFVTFVTNHAPFNTFVKSASYLMHNTHFTSIKDLILAHAENLFQDDTGIPYKDFKKNLGFEVQFYGEYVKPVKDFGDARYQPDLDSAFKASTTRQKLPFSLGYHWGSAKQHYILVRKREIGEVK
jgi:hypothetical protein